MKKPTKIAMGNSEIVTTGRRPQPRSEKLPIRACSSAAPTAISRLAGQRFALAGEQRATRTVDIVAAQWQPRRSADRPQTLILHRVAAEQMTIEPVEPNRSRPLSTIFGARAGSA